MISRQAERPQNPMPTTNAAALHSSQNKTFIALVTTFYCISLLEQPSAIEYISPSVKPSIYWGWHSDMFLLTNILPQKYCNDMRETVSVTRLIKYNVK